MDSIFEREYLSGFRNKVIKAKVNLRVAAAKLSSDPNNEDFKRAFEIAESEHLSASDEYKQMVKRFRENVVPKFKLGDKVYLIDGASCQICELKKPKEIYGCYDFGVVNPYGVEVRCVCKNGYPFDGAKSRTIVHANEKNYEMLCELFPEAPWESPPMNIRGNELCEYLLDSGQRFVPVVVLHDEEKYLSLLSEGEISIFDDVYFDIIHSYDPKLTETRFESKESAYQFVIPFDVITSKVLGRTVVKDFEIVEDEEEDDE